MKRQITRFGIIKKLQSSRAALNGFKVKKIGLFGSFARQSQTKKSDIDIIARVDSPSFDNYMELKFYLQKLFGRKVDLVLEETLKPAYKYVVKEAIYAT